MTSAIPTLDPAPVDERRRPAVMLMGWDLAPTLCGWAAGDGSRLPIAGAFHLDEGVELGALGVEFQNRALSLQRRFQATHWLIEAPLHVPRRNKLIVLRQQYGLSFLLATLGVRLGVTCRFVDYDEVKRYWTGDDKAKKDQMIAMCVKLGITLPPTKAAGRADAADACGVWKVGVRLFARQHLTRWDQALYRRQGALV